MKTFIFNFVLIICFICSKAFSQGVECLTPTPINLAAQLDYQYNPNTGTANIQIPLCGISAGRYFLPVSINYNTAGIKVNQVASCVGLGWELSAEGSISRIIRGLPDDQNDGYGKGWLHTNTNAIQAFPLDGDELTRLTWLEGVLKEETGEKDTEPDLFYLSLSGINCSFVLGNGTADTSAHREVILIPYNNIKITYTINYAGKLTKFRIIDSNGNIYYLDVPVITHNTVRTMTNSQHSYMTQDFPYINLSNGIGRNTKFHSDKINTINFNRIDVDIYNTISQVSIDSWKVSNIITPLRDTMAFTYTNETIPLDKSYYKSYAKYGSNDPDSVLAYQILNEEENSAYIEDKKIVGIESKTGKIEFVYDNADRDDLPDSKKLNLVRAYSKQNGNYYLNREFTLYQEYFESCNSVVYNNLSEANYRLKLDSLIEKNGEYKLPSYIFYYDYSINRKLPSRFSYAQDIWGFYNGQVQNNTFIPEVYIYPDRIGNDRFRYYPASDSVPGHGFDDRITLEGANRLPNEDYMSIGMLGRIKTPTNEEISFEYEPHQFLNDTADDHTVYIGDGLRLKEKYTNIAETYYYESYTSHQSSGAVLAMPAFGYFDPSYWPVEEEDRDQDYFSENYVRVNQDLSSYPEGSILYNEVYIQDSFEGTKLFKFDNGPVLGIENPEAFDWYTQTQIYHCRSAYDLDLDLPPLLDGLTFGPGEYPYVPHSYYQWNRGLIKESLSLDEQGQKVARTVNEYEIFTPYNNAPDSVCGIQIGFLKNNTPNNLRNPLYIYGKYPVYGNIANVLSNSKEIIYDPDDEEDSLLTQTFYEYNSFGQLSSSNFINSNGDELISRIKYIPDYWDTTHMPTTSDPMTAAMIAFYNKNILDIPVESLQFLIKNDDEDEYLVGGELNTFRYFYLNNVISPIPLPDSGFILSLQYPVLIENFTVSGIESLDFIRDSRYECKLINDLYSPSGILLQSHAKNGTYNSSIPGYDSTMIIASCANAFTDEFGYTGFENNDTNGWEAFGTALEIITTSDAKSGLYVLSPDYNSGVKKDFDIQAGFEDQAGYEASVWAKGNSTTGLSISINGTDNIHTAVSISANEWNLLTVKLTRQEIESYNGTINFIRVMIKNTGYTTCWFDDLRFHPSDASMSTNTYDSCYLTSSVNNPNNRYSYFEYDPIGLLLRVRDHDRNILSENDMVIERIGTSIDIFTKTTVLKIPEDDPEQLNLMAPSQKSELYQYFNEKGNLSQSVSWQHTPNLKDLVSFITFDNFDRENAIFLPFESEFDDGRKVPGVVTAQKDFYNEDHEGITRINSPYSCIRYDQSPLNRITETSHPGTSWQIAGGHTNRRDIYFNAEEEIFKFNFNNSNMNCYVNSGDENYARNSLLCQESTDENDNISATYFDKTGQLICTRNMNGNQEYYTYYIYNDLGQLVYLIPPEAFHQMQTADDYSFSPTDPISAKYIFYYSYDSRGRLAQRKVPGIDTVYYIYDNLDQLIMKQDGNLRSSNKWEFNAYDVLGRVIIAGIFTSPYQNTQEEMQDTANYYLTDLARNFETFICESCTTQYETGYTHSSFPYMFLSSCSVMNVNYYDSYDWDFDQSYPFNDDLTENSANIFGRLSAQKIRVLNNANPPEWLFRVLYYDEQGRLVETCRDNHMGGKDIDLSDPDFTGTSTRNRRYHEINNTTISEYLTPWYDHANRVTTLQYSIDDEYSPIFLFKNTYNELDQLVKRQIHSTDERNFLQTLNYKYNSRGWVKNINQSNLDNSHYYIHLDQLLSADETVVGIRIDSLRLNLEQLDSETLSFNFIDEKEAKVYDEDGFTNYRYQDVDEHSETLVKVGTIGTEDFNTLVEICGRSFTFLFQEVFFSSCDEEQMITDSLSSIVKQQIIDAGIENSGTIDVLANQVVTYILKSISFIYFNENNNDLFGEDIYYDNQFIPGLASIPYYNGNISAVKWQTTQNPGRRSYCFHYDNLDQMLDAGYAEYEDGNWDKNQGRYDESGITYDRNGNILTLNRNGITGVNTFGRMDSLAYTYDGNMLIAVHDDIANSGTNNNDFKDNISYSTTEYEYDSNGNMVSDDNKGIQSISYNFLNLPEEIVFSQSQKINYLYAADGTKLRETITDGQMTHTFDYCSNLVYEDEELSFILTPEGRAIPDGEHGYLYEYFLRDHLGNIRVVFGDADQNDTAEVIQENHYYPFGMTMVGLDYHNGLESRYFYQGKEMTDDFRLYWSDFHARRFDSQLGRWHMPDPAGQFASPYIGMGNNPIGLVDPDGRFVDRIHGSPLTGRQLYSYAKFLWFKGYSFSGGIWHAPQSLPNTSVNSDYEPPWWERESEEQLKRAVELSFRLDRLGITSTTHDGGVIVQYEWANGKEAGNILLQSWNEFYANFSNWAENYATEEQINSIKWAFEKAQPSEDNSLYNIGIGLNAIGFISSTGEYSNVVCGCWRGANGKWYAATWGGNQWSGPRSKILSRASAFKLASRSFFVIGSGISLYQSGDALLLGDYTGAAKSGLDIGMSAYATFGGPSGWIIGGGYFLLDGVGAFGPPTITTPYIPPLYAVPDNTYVAPPIIIPLR